MAVKESTLTFPKEIGDSFLLCGICTERYKNAKVLQCLHSFCEPCLGKLAADCNAITCPICRRSHEVPDNGVSGIDNNVFLNNLVELFSKNESTESEKCGICLQGSLVKHCIECSMDICESCATTHQRIPATRTHSMLMMDDYVSAKSVDPASVQAPLHCCEHPQYEIEFYCDTCEKEICVKCTALVHSKPEHHYRCIAEAAEEYTNVLTASIDKVKMKGNQAKDSKGTATIVSKSLDETFTRETEKLKEHIRQTIEDVTRLIQEDGDKRLAEIKDEYDKRKVHLNSQIKELEIIEDDVVTASEYAENLVHYRDAAQLMIAKKGLDTKVRELLTLQTVVDPVEDDYMLFQPCGDFCKEKKLGMLETTRTLYKLVDIPTFVRINEEISLTMEALHETSQIKCNGKIKQVDVVVTSPGNVQEKMAVFSNNNGTLTLKTRAKTEGVHEVSAFVREKPVNGLPVRIQVIRKKGLICQFGGNGSGDGQFSGIYGLTITRTGNILVCDYDNPRAQSFNMSGKFLHLLKFTQLSSNPSLFDAAVAASGDILYTDDDQNRVVVCDERGKVLKCFGEGKFRRVAGITVCPVTGTVYTADDSSNVIVVHDQDGNYIKSFGGPGNKEGEFSSPWFVCTDSKGNVYVSDKDNNRIQVFDGYCRFRYTFGSEGSGDRRLKSPSGVAVDKRGYIYVSDSGNKRIVKYKPGGKFLCRIDSDSDGLSSPQGICLTDDEPFAKVVVVDNENCCVNIFAQ
ncbi:tripartite motif-containing protein 2-like [Ptychodera flava]|uniref:tripartite motif-containing protein 2-like n=1 Tax=Ptychodera flava TaxID=63121 RepID=UPI00396A8CB2